MKQGPAKILFLVALIFLNASTSADAQSVLTTLYAIGGGADGYYPQAGLTLSGNKLYGAMLSEGTFGKGSVFAINTDGSGFTNLYSFSSLPYYTEGTNTDGAFPFSDLVLSDGTLYGTAWVGGYFGAGTVFAVNTNGTGFKNLHNFTSGDGANPYTGLVLSGNTLYGTASNGGSSGYGTVFAVNTDGTGFTNLYSFTALDPTTHTNADGANPRARLVLAGATLYGTAPNGGTAGQGVVFAIHTDGTGFTNLHNFTGVSDGANPYASLALSGNKLYGTASAGGSSGSGTVFAITTDGTGFTNLYNFTGGSDGAGPYGGLILSGKTIYGTTGGGGAFSAGTVFAVNTDGTGFANLYAFGSDGGQPAADLVLAGNRLYGTTANGGASGHGTVFVLTLIPSIEIAPEGNQAVVSWPTWAPNYALQVTTNLSSGAWGNSISVTNMVGNDYIFTNSVSVNSMFFRLIGQ